MEQLLIVPLLPIRQPNIFINKHLAAPKKSVHMRGAKTVSPQNHVNPTASSSKSKRTQLPQRQKASGEGAALYKNKKYRRLVSRERVTAQFQQPQQVSRDILNAAWSAHNQGKTPWGKNHALLVKGGQLGQVSNHISLHSQAIKQPLATNKGEIEQQGRQVIDNLQKGFNELSQLLNQQGGIMHPTEFQQLNGLLRTFHNEQKLMLQVMDDPGVASVAGSLDLTQAMELKRLGYDLTPTMVKHFSSFNDSQLIRGSDQNFGSGAIHSVTKLQFQTSTGVVEKSLKVMTLLILAHLIPLLAQKTILIKANQDLPHATLQQQNLTTCWEPD